MLVLDRRPPLHGSTAASTALLQFELAKKIGRDQAERAERRSVMGFGGNGITYAVIAAEFVARLLAGEEDSDADLYRFGMP